VICKHFSGCVPSPRHLIAISQLSIKLSIWLADWLLQLPSSCQMPFDRSLKCDPILWHIYLRLRGPFTSPLRYLSKFANTSLGIYTFLAINKSLAHLSRRSKGSFQKYIHIRTYIALCLAVCLQIASGIFTANFYYFAARHNHTLQRIMGGIYIPEYCTL